MNGIILTHGAGGNAEGKLLIALAKTFEAAGWKALRYNLPFRQLRPKGPPYPAQAAADRAGLAETAAQMRSQVDGIVAIGGQSYGGRQASILLSEHPEAAAALLLMSYPLHPPGKPEQMRTTHFPSLKTPALFVQGTRDPFATIEELRTAIASIPSNPEVLTVEGAGHDLRGADPAVIVSRFQQILR